MASMISNFFNKALFWRKPRSHVTENQNENANGDEDINEDEESEPLTRFEYFLYCLLEIVVWNYPFVSFLFLTQINLIYWFVEGNCTFFGLLFSALLAYFAVELTCNHFSPQMEKFAQWLKSVPLLTTPYFTFEEIDDMAFTIEEVVISAYQKIKRLREEQPGTFCVLSCGFFFLLSAFGRAISDGTLLYILFMIVMTVPGFCIHVLPYYFPNSFKFVFESSQEENDNEVEEYLPETNAENLQLLNAVGELSLTPKEDDEDSNDILLEQISARTNDTAESSCSKLSFSPDASLMPSHENSLDFLDFEMPSKNQESKKSDSDDSEHSDIHFQNRHFNGDSSDEEEFSKGLEFKQSDIKTKRIPEESKGETSNIPSLMSAANIGRNLITMGANILTSAVKPAEPARNDRESSSDTDSFELISEEDM